MTDEPKRDALDDLIHEVRDNGGRLALLDDVAGLGELVRDRLRALESAPTPAKAGPAGDRRGRVEWPTEEGDVYEYVNDASAAPPASVEADDGHTVMVEATHVITEPGQPTRIVSVQPTAVEMHPECQYCKEPATRCGQMLCEAHFADPGAPSPSTEAPSPWLDVANRILADRQIAYDGELTARKFARLMAEFAAPARAGQGERKRLVDACSFAIDWLGSGGRRGRPVDMPRGGAVESVLRLAVASVDDPADAALPPIESLPTVSGGQGERGALTATERERRGLETVLAHVRRVARGEPDEIASLMSGIAGVIMGELRALPAEPPREDAELLAAAKEVAGWYVGSAGQTWDRLRAAIAKADSEGRT